MKIKFIFSVSFLLFSITAIAQSPEFKVEGMVHSYEHAHSQGFLKKGKPTLLQGTLEDAKINVLSNGNLIQQLNTDYNGLFSFTLKFDQLYQIIVSKKGYSQSQLIIDTRAFPEKIKKGGFNFIKAEFLLNSYNQGGDTVLNKNLGRLFYNPSKNEFLAETIQQKESGGLFGSSSYMPDAPAELLDRAIKKNNERLANYQPLLKHTVSLKRKQKPEPKEEEVREKKNITKTVKKEEPGAPYEESALVIPRNLGFSPLLFNADEEMINMQEEAVRREREQLMVYRLRVKTKDDSLEILRREKQINLAENEIAKARLLISAQEEKLSAQQSSMFLMVSLLVLFSGSSFLVFTYYRQRQMASREIESKNKQITDSISYARRIQQSILVGENMLQQYLPESFVFLQPKAIVSGDFYFIAPVGQKFLVAVSDCTGHGVPGAFMSLIGNRLLREIIVEKGIHDPAEVLEQLHIGINKSLNQSDAVENSQDGMDIAVCLIDPEAYTLVFAGAMNPAYLVYDQELQVLPADVSSVGGKTLRRRDQGKKKFTNKACKYNSGCMLYLFTDGYMDQFGGALDQKFNTRRFKQMLMDIQPLSAEEQKEIITTTLMEWKKEKPQTDDILMLGIRLL